MWQALEILNHKIFLELWEIETKRILDSLARFY